MATKKNQRVHVPRSAREAVLEGMDLHAGAFTATDRFIGPHAVLRVGEIIPDPGNGGQPLAIPYTARITFGRPRPAANGGQS